MCKVSIVEATLMTLDGETQRNYRSNSKSTQWQSSLAMLKNQLLENISFNLQLKANKKKHKLNSEFFFKQNDKNQWLAYA